MNDNNSLELPPALQVRLDAAGVTDEASLMAALEADPQLRSDFQAFVAGHQQEIFQAVWHEFVTVDSLEDLQFLVQQSPFLLEAEFLRTVEYEIERAEQAGQPVLADGLRQRLAALRDLRSTVSTTLPPVAQALMDFIQAPTNAAARKIFAEQRDLLLPDDAQRVLDQQFRSDDPEVQQIIGERSKLLQQLRTAEQPPADAHADRENQPEAHAKTTADLADVAQTPPPDAYVKERLANLLVAFLNTHDLPQMRQLLEAYPALLTDEVEPVFDLLFQQYADEEAAIKTLQDRQALLRACRAEGLERVFASLERVSASMSQVERFEQALNSFIEQRNAAAEEPTSIAGWQQAVAAGERLLQPPLSETPELDLPALQVEVARIYNELGNAFDQVKDHNAALAAYERAIALQADFAMWHRNRAGMLIELRRLDEAEAAIAHARMLEPDAPRLAELAAELEHARSG